MLHVRRLMAQFVVGLALLTAALPAQAEIGVEEKLGNTLPLEAQFVNEEGKTVTLKDLIDRPTILALVYFRCPGICGPLMGGLADIVEKMEMTPGDEYQIITISFDPTEGPELAKRKKATYHKVIRRPVGDASWRFLTGKQDAIDAITEAVGFQYEQTGKDFQHPAVIAAISPEGKLTRYLYGVEFLPFDVKLALIEAADGRVGPTISKVLLYCFSYDPEGQTYVFNILKVTGTVTLLFLALSLVFLVITTRRYRKNKQAEA
jgi:protein SCO1